jgi:hypothetical protein
MLTDAMKYRLLLVTACVFAISFSTTVNAQEACSSLMKFGIYDEDNTASTRTQFRLAKAWLCDTQFQSYEDVRRAGAAIGIDVGVLIGASAESSSEQRETRWRQFCATSYEQIQDNFSLRLAIRSISPALMGLVKHCLDTQQTGFMAWIETSQDRKTFSYFARYRPNGNEKARIEAFDITPVEVERTCRRKHPTTFRLFQVGRLIGNAPLALTCSVNPGTTVTITLVADKAGPDGTRFVRTLDGVNPEPEHYEGQYEVYADGYSTANKWLSTGLILPARSRLTITATGRACLAAGNPGSCSGPTGLPSANPGCAALGITCGALYGKIGINGSPFFIGPSLRITTSEAGNLFLGYGDINFADNTGSFTVHVAADAPPVANRAPRGRILNANH